MRKATDLVESFEKKNNNKYKISFRTLFEKALDQYDEKYPHKHRKTEGFLSISQISGNSCMRKNYYDLMGYPKQSIPFRNRLIMDFGTRLHELAQQCMGEFGYLQGVEQFMEDKELKVCGSTDGWLVNKHNQMIFNDIKTTNLNGYMTVLSSDKPKKDHRHQVHWYSYIMRKHHNIKIDRLKITYICKNQSSYSPLWENDYKNLNSIMEKINSSDNDFLTDQERANLNFIAYKLNKDKELINGDDFLIKEVDFDYDEKIIKEEIEKVNKFWQLIENNKELIEKGKKEKLPNKIKDGVICASCQFRKVCRNYD